MRQTNTDSFTTEIPLRTAPAQEQALLARLEAARQVYNACLGESLKRLALLRQSKCYRAALKIPEGKARSQAFRKAQAAVGFREYDLHAYAVQFNHCWIGEHLDINTIQKLATRAFNAAQQHAFGQRGRPRFKGRHQMDSVEGKSNASGIRWREGHVEWLGLELEAIIGADDLVIAHGLKSRVKYVRLVRRKLNGRHRFYAQLVCEGRPYQKPQNRPGQGVVGLDIGPSTIAAVGEGEAFLEQFCADLAPRQDQIRRLQRRIDRQRRANNPDNYLPDGRIRPGPKVWRRSSRQRQTESQLAEAHRRMAAHRKTLHGQMTNRVLRMGNTIQLEKVSYRAFQRQYGKSVGVRAPGMFVQRLKRKAESADASVVEFPTRTTRLSQTCHGCGRIAPKPLAQRWHICDCGIVAQRDLYSAFLASCVEGDRLNAGQAEMRWPGVDSLLQAALSRIQPANGRPVPSSFGLNSRRQSRSPVKANVNAVEAQDVVPSIAPGNAGESLRETAESLEPPGFSRGE
ncbi:MAG: transposase [Chloroflexi bacterium]|nr:transposase [Chloroflexota bacterium]